MKSLFDQMIVAAISIVILAAIMPITFGASETIVLGQYEVSFDLNTSLNHTIEVQPPVVGENDTNYGAYITFTNETQILMGIDVLINATDSTLEPELRFVKCLASHDENATVTTRIVNNQTGIETTSLSKTGDSTFTFRSWLDSQKCDCGEVFAGTTKLEILGIVSRNISENLLNTLHVTSLANISMEDQQNLQPNNTIQLSGEQGAAIAKAIEPQPPLSPSPNIPTNKPYLENAWLESFAPADPAYYYLHAWANL
jgi:hypothetical protein